ncbi:hypothetical protein R69658_02540 [Paraburkholderia aspalathi]|uniref:Uncharacterized protein n=1 Tax=Paraburkholderia aspalathi TaxID=1324617 RepID=A0ABM8RDJ5_9BURK|nr:hypothetical protein [Paraburkholderia aspalathi]MBK3817804.1 hypothetical protein [Paraburkholderia aspalathi]MBK3829580.1 hypothetical protein [Paraburkholderia aspalathi]MBK3859400.1 hypothetical protein [Paraburkholderia aspalathi]CAE6747126.1 hypothetical protein R69658_02540 [Paraburkholderia aspalathi]
MSDDIQAVFEGPDLNAIADRLWGKPAELAAPPDAAEAAAQLERGAAINERTAADKADAARKESFEQHGLWKTPGELPKTEVPDNIKALREADAERRLYTAEKTYSGVQIESAMETTEGDPAIKAVVARETREIFADIGASTDDAQQIIDAASRFSAEPITPERDASNANDAIDALNREFGNDAADALKAAQKMVLRDPRLARILDESRLGNDPLIVVKLAQLARSQRARGKL